MKTLNIRLDDESLDILEQIKREHGFATLNGTIRFAIGTAGNLGELLTDIQSMFIGKVEVDQKKFNEMNIKYGLLQKTLF